MQSACLVILLGMATSVIGCAALPFDPASETQRLLRRDAEWAQAASAGTDVERIVSYWSDDAVVIPQGQPVVDFQSETFGRTSGIRLGWIVFDCPQSN